MPKFEVYHDARITYKWHREIEADSADDAIDQVMAIRDTFLEESVDPYGTETEGRPFIEVDWSSGEWDAITSPIPSEPEDDVATSEDL